MKFKIVESVKLSDIKNVVNKIKNQMLSIDDLPANYGQIQLSLLKKEIDKQGFFMTHDKVEISKILQGLSEWIQKFYDEKSIDK